MHRIPSKGPPVILIHGIADSSDSFIMNNKKSPAFVFAKMGYDVWLGNARGNKYSRRHGSLNSKTDWSYWDHSW